MTAYTDANGVTTVYEYETWSGGRRLKRILDPYRKVGGLPAATVLNYNANGIASIVEPGPGGRTTNFTVNTNGELVEWVDPDGRRTEFAYDASHRLINVKDRAGAVQSFEYDTLTNKLARIVGPAVPVDQGNGTVATETPEVNYVTWQTALIPRDTSIFYTGPSGNRFSQTITDAAHGTTTITTNTYGYPVSISNAVGEVTRFEYARRPYAYRMTSTGLVIDSILAPLVTKKTHPDGSIDNFVFSFDKPMVQMTSEQKAGASAVNYAYKDTVPLMLDSIWGNNTSTTKFGYSTKSFGKPSQVQEIRRYSEGSYMNNLFADYYITYYTYDSVTGRVAKEWEFLRGESKAKTYTYDPIFGNLSEATGRGLPGVKKVFDAHGRDSLMLSSGNAPIRMLYDAMDRIVERRALTGSPVVTTMLYDSLDLKSITDGKGQVYAFDRDIVGRTTRAYAANSTTSYRSYRYDIKGNLSSVTNRRGQRIQMTYDGIGRLRNRVGSGIADSFVVYTNFAANWNSISRDTVRTTITSYYAKAASMATTRLATDPTKRTYVNQTLYPAWGEQDSLFVELPGPEYSIIRYGREQFISERRTISMQDSWGMMWVPFLGQSVDFFQRPMYESQMSTSTSFVPYTDDDRVIASQSSIASIGKSAYMYDSLNRFVAIQDERNNLQRQYKYDSLGRLSRVEYRTQSCQQWPEVLGMDSVLGFINTCVATPDSFFVFTYDAVGNRTDKTHSYGNGNQMLTFGNLTFTYDADGNVTQKSNSSTGVTWRYHWDILNRLSSTVRAGGDSITYEYDAKGKLVRRKTNGVIDRHWVYMGDHILAELDGELGQLNRYIYRLGVDKPITVTTGKGTFGTNYHNMLQDQLGNVVYHGSGSLSQEIVYDPWGAPSIILDNTGSRLFWKGLLYQDGPGLYYVRNRWYDPEVGRFISEDPIGLEGGINLYQFAAGDPINLSDPSGLTTYISCREIDFTSNFGHCGIHIKNRDLDLDVLIELERTGRGWLAPFGYKNVPWLFGSSMRDPLSAYDGGWHQVMPPSGMTETDFDVAVFDAAALVSSRENGRRYNPFGQYNSNRFIYDVITSAGGRVPGSVSLFFVKGTPGLCGGSFWSTGRNCAWW